METNKPYSIDLSILFNHMVLENGSHWYLHEKDNRLFLVGCMPISLKKNIPTMNIAQSNTVTDGKNNLSSVDCWFLFGMHMLYRKIPAGTQSYPLLGEKCGLRQELEVDCPIIDELSTCVSTPLSQHRLCYQDQNTQVALEIHDLQPMVFMTWNKHARGSQKTCTVQQ